MEDVKEYTAFIKERIKTSLFPEEISALHKGLKFLNLSLGRYVQLQMKSFTEKDLNADSFPDVNILTLPQAPLAKRIISRTTQLNAVDEAILDDFFAVQLTLSFLTFEYIRINDGHEIALEYAKYMVRAINKLKKRIGTEPPLYVAKYLENMSSEVDLLEKDIQDSINIHSTAVIKDAEAELKRLIESLHYLQLNQKANQMIKPVLLQKTVYQIQFSVLGGTQFERLVFAYAYRTKTWDNNNLDWFGQSGSEGGRDIWGVCAGESVCYQCANHATLTFQKAKEDIDKLVKNKTIPVHFILVCGGSASANLKKKIKIYGKSKKIKSVETWTGVEFEEKLRRDTVELVERFVNGVEFPDKVEDLIAFAKGNTLQNDKEIIDLLAECLERPAFSTKLAREGSIHDMGIALDRTIEVLNTGVHRLNDGTFIKNIPSRHRVADIDLKQRLAELTELIVKVRDEFVRLKKKKEIRQYGESDAYESSPMACDIIDGFKQQILDSFRGIKPDFKVHLNN